MDDIVIKPSPANTCTKFDCVICGGETLKTSAPMAFIHPADGEEYFVCENCIWSGGAAAINQKLREHAERLRLLAEDLCRLAEARFIVSTSGEIDGAN